MLDKDPIDDLKRNGAAKKGNGTGAGPAVIVLAEMLGIRRHVQSLRNGAAMLVSRLRRLEDKNGQSVRSTMES